MGFLRNPTLVNEAPPTDFGGSDAVLVSQARQGDAQAFALLYRRYLDQVYDFTYHRLGSPEAAQDATSTTFLNAYAGLARFREDTLFVGWLFAIARHVVTDTYRSRRQGTVTFDDSHEFEDPAETPEELALKADQVRELRRARETCLSESERELLDLRLQELSNQEIAVALDVSHGAVRTAQYRLVKKLRDCLGVGHLQKEERLAHSR